jgi:uncharacterized protein YegP (UPF0339 family)
MAYFRKYKDHRGEWRWTFYARNGEEIAVSSEGYVREADCDTSIGIVKRDTPNAEVRRAAA